MKSRRKNRIPGKLFLAAAAVALLLSCLAFIIFAEDEVATPSISSNGTRLVINCNEASNTYTYAWEISSEQEGTYAPILGQVGKYYDITTEDEGKYIRAVVNGSYTEPVGPIGKLVVMDIGKGSISFSSGYSGKDKDGNTVTGTHKATNLYLICHTNRESKTANSISFSGNHPDKPFDITLYGVNMGEDPTNYNQQPGSSGSNTPTGGSINIPANSGNVKQVILRLRDDNIIRNITYYVRGGDSSSPIETKSSLKITDINGDGEVSGGALYVPIKLTTEEEINYFVAGKTNYNHWNAGIGGTDGNSQVQNFHIAGGKIQVLTTLGDNCTAIGAGGNGYCQMKISGGQVIAHCNGTGAAIGGGIGWNQAGGVSDVLISGGDVYAKNHANIQSGNETVGGVAIGSGSSFYKPGSSATVTITGGEVEAYGTFGNGIGGGNSSTSTGGDAKISIGGGTVYSTSIGGGNSKKGNGGTATVTVSGTAQVFLEKGIGGGLSENGTGGGAMIQVFGGAIECGGVIGGGNGGQSGNGGLAEIIVSDGRLTSTSIGGGVGGSGGHGGAAAVKISGGIIKTGSIGGGTTLNPSGSLGYATADITGGDISGQFIMAKGATNPCYFKMSGGVLHGVDTINGTDYDYSNKNGAAVFMDDPSGTVEIIGGIVENCFAESGGAIYMTAGTVTLKDSGVIQNCRSTQDGGAIYLGGGKVLMSGGTIQTCSVDEYGGAIYVTGGSVEMSGGMIENCSAKTGGGIYVNGGDFSMSGGFLQENTATENGGGVCVNGGDVTVTGGNIEYNEAQNGGGVYLTGGAFTLNGDSASINHNSATNGGGVYLTKINPTLLQGSITENTATENGGGICIDQAEVQLAPSGRVTISQNKAKNGAGIYIGGTEGNLAGFSVSADCLGEVHFDGNIATENGGGACLSYGNFSIDSDKILLYGNQAANGGGVAVLNGSFNLSAGAVGVIEKEKNHAASGGGVYVNGGNVTVTGGNIEYNEAQNGGGVYLTGGAFTLNGDGASINHNSATNGGGVYLTKINPTLLQGSIAENTATENGGGICIDQAEVQLAPSGRVTISKNNAKNGAGLYINGTVGNTDAGFSVNPSSAGTVTLTDNIASENGGGVYVNNGFFTMNTDHLILQKNGAQNGGAVYVNGGNATLSVGTVDQNTASQNGGGIYVNGGLVTLSGATVTGNTATENGGGIAVSNGNVTMLGGKVDRNHAVNGSGGGIYVTTTGNTTVKIQSGSISYNQNNIYGGALAVYGGDTGTITITIGLKQKHYDEQGNLLEGCDHNNDATADDSCPVIKDNTVAMEGGAIYIKGGSQTILGIYCLIEGGNRAGGLSAGSEKTTLNDFMMVKGGNVTISSADECGNTTINGSIHVMAGNSVLEGTMTNPQINAPITVDITTSGGSFQDNRTNLPEEPTIYKIHYYENFKEGGTTVGRYTAYSVSSAEEYYTIEAVHYAHTGYTILGWCAFQDPDEQQLQEYLYATGSQLEVTKIPTLPGYSPSKETLFLYAQWSSNAYYIQFDPNTSAYTGSMENQTLSCTSEAVLKENQYLRELYVFLGWGTTKDQTKPTYFDEALIDPLSSEDGDVVILYAIWGSCTHEEMEITSLEGEVTTHNPTLAYSAEGATLTVTCSCAYCESATLHAENAIYDGNPHKASVTYTHGVLLKDLEIGYVYALPEGVDIVGDEAKYHNGYCHAGTYTATIAKGVESASLTYVIERAPQAAPSEKPKYSVNGNTLTVTTVYATGESGEAVQYSLYVDIPSWEITWGSSADMTFDAAWTTYYAQVRYPGNRNYLPSDVVRSDLKHFYKGKVSISIVTDAGMNPSLQETNDSLQIIIDLLSGYYYSNLTHTIDSIGFTEYMLELDETVDGDRRTYTPKTPIPDTEGATITITFQGTVKKATASAMVKPGEVFSAITSTVETKIARDSAFTVNFRIEDYANYSNLTLTFGEQSLPIGTTVILKELTDGTYWWMKLESPSQSIPLTSFQKMGTDEKFADPTAKTLHYQFVIDFSDVTGGCTEDALTVSLTATPSGHAPELKPSANVTLKEISFSVGKGTEEADAQESVDVTFAQTEGTASKWDGLTGYLLLTPTGEKDLPPDLVLRVTQGDATALYQRNAEGFFAVKLTNGESNLILSLESEMFPDADATYSFSATLHATAVHDAPKSDVIAELTEDLIFTIPAKAAEPMAKLTGTQRVVTLGGTLKLTPAVSYDEGRYDCVIKIQYKSGNGYEDTSLQVTDWKSGEEQEINLASIRTEGSYRVVAVISQKGTGTTVLAVPYYFVIE